jgi:hypothetical protein
MNLSRVSIVAFLIGPALYAQGVRGVTRRTPTVVYGQHAAQFFAAGGVPLNAPTNAAAIPGAPNQNLAGRPASVPANTLAARPTPQPRPGQPAQPAGLQPGRQPATAAPAGQQVPKNR